MDWDFDITVRDLSALAIVATFMGGVIGFIVRAWIRSNLSGVFVEHTDLSKVQAAVDGVKSEVGTVKNIVERVTERTEALEEQVHALPTKEDVKTIRHDVKDVLQQNAALGAAVRGHGETLQGIERRQEILLKALLPKGAG